jgi:hypothetical protein
MTRVFRTIIEYDNFDAFIVRNVIVKNGFLIMDLHDPISPNSCQKLMKDLMSEKLFSFSLKIFGCVGELVLKRDFVNATLLDVNFGPRHREYNQHEFITTLFEL